MCRSARTPFFTVVGFFLMLGLRSAVSEISGNTIFEHGGCFFFMLGLRSAVCEISGNTIFVARWLVFS